MVKLAPEQQAIVTHPVDQHAVVLAVAGSGKSTTMAERIAYLVEATRVDPSHILAVMFNKAASLELAEKLAKRLGKRNAPQSITYHRLGTLSLNWLIKAGKVDAWTFEASPYKAIYFTARVIEKACKWNGHKYPNLVAEVFQGFVDRVKSDMCTPAEAWANGDWDDKYVWFIGAYDDYEKARAKAKMRFFSDLIYDPVKTMQDDPSAAAVVADRFAHVIVDEYQDICESQQALIRFVAGKKARVMVVGDDDQTIYTWRGAKPSYILRDFELDFPGAKVYNLTRTWRYGHALSCAANYVISQNTDRAEKLCISGPNAPNTSLHLVQAEDDGAAALKVVRRKLNDGLALGDIAILVRSYSSSASSQFKMLEAGVPFRLEGGDHTNVLNSPWVLGLLGWMELAAGLHARHAYVGEPDKSAIFQIKQFINVPSNGNLSWEAQNQLCSLVLQYPADGEGFGIFTREHLAVSDGSISDRLHKKRMLWRRLQELSPNAKNINALDLLDDLVEFLGIEQAITASVGKRAQSNSDEVDEELAVVQAFIQYVKTCSAMTLVEFLEHINNLKTFSDRAKQLTEAVHMTSVHRSKGLEWPCVIMVGLKQGKFPFQSRNRPIKEEKWESHLEDERRLFYVGMTRAKNHLYLIAPVDTRLNAWLRAGRSGSPQLPFDNETASQFLYETNLYLSSFMGRLVNESNEGLAANDPSLANAYLELLGKHNRVRKVGEVG